MFFFQNFPCELKPTFRFVHFVKEDRDYSEAANSSTQLFRMRVRFFLSNLGASLVKINIQ